MTPVCSKIQATTKNGVISGQADKSSNTKANSWTSVQIFRISSLKFGAF